MKWFIKCIRNYGTFTGRARRAEYWYFTLFVIIFSVLLNLLDLSLFGLKGFRWFSMLFSLAIVLPGIAVGVRRLHDTGRSGKLLMWYYIFALLWGFYLFFVIVTQGLYIMSTLANGVIPDMSPAFLTMFFGGLAVMFVWAIVLLVFYCKEGDKGENKYGPDPKAVEE